MLEALDVAIVGSGPSGLAAATALKRAGVSRVAVFERESEPGGIPRHCDHATYGLREFGRLMRGPAYARRLVRNAIQSGLEIRTATSVVSIGPDATLTVTSSQHGVEVVRAQRVLLATGAREAPRSARFIGGTKPGGVLSTGALQQLVHLQRTRPFDRPIIVGTELVAFSALMTCLSAGIRPVAMVEENARTAAFWPSAIYPRLRGVPLHLGTKLVAIHGHDHDTGVTVKDRDGTRDIDCDGVILTGRFVSDTALLLASGLPLDDERARPLVDETGRLPNTAIYATGNIMHPGVVRTAGHCYRAGQAVAGNILAELERG